MVHVISYSSSTITVTINHHNTVVCLQASRYCEISTVPQN